MANTFIELNDTPSSFSGSALKFVRVTAANSLTFADADLNAIDIARSTEIKREKPRYPSHY